MGEMIKFGIKLALTIATAVALVAALLILYNLVSSFSFSSTTSQILLDVFHIFSLAFPVNLHVLFTVLSSLFSFKVAYWAADKMIQFISASS